MEGFLKTSKPGSLLSHKAWPDGLLVSHIELERFGLHLPFLRWRLDPESLILWQRLFKFWYELINSQSFLYMHLRFNKSLFFKWTRPLDYISIALLVRLFAAELVRFGLHLPEDVVEEILMRLGPESLIVCKRRCNLWYELINSQSFVDKHLHFNIQNHNKSLFFKWTRQELSSDDIFIGLLVHLIVLERFGLHLPEDVVLEEILWRLGPESLIVCKNCCELWYKLINTQSFVDNHLRFNIQDHNKSLFFKWTHPLDDIFFDRLSKQVQVVTISKDEAGSSVSLALVPKKLDILAAFHLILLEKHLAFLCNPALTIFKSFPFEFDFEAALLKRFVLQLPEDVVEEILLRLPPESLIVCKRVCKLWYELINRQSFVDKHLRFNIQKHSSSSSVSLFFKWTRQELSLHEIFIGHLRVRNHHQNDLSKQVLSLVTISSDDASATSTSDDLPCDIEQVNLPPFVVEQVSLPRSVVETDISPPVHKQIENLAAIHCHGIICLFDVKRRSSVVLCNPALRIFKILHSPGLVPGFRSIGLGFGHDPRANVYKLVRIYGSVDPKQLVCRAKVYNLGTDSWREIVAPKEYCFLNDKGVYCRGVFYWWNITDKYSTIVSFDMSEEEFHFIPVPDDVVGENRNIHELAVWNDSVVIFFSTEFSWFSTCFEMWVMVDSPGNGVEANPTYWTKHLTIGPLACIYRPLEFWKDDELLMETRDGLIASYNLHTQNLRILPILGAVYPGLTYVSLCFKSLVLL